MTVDQIIAALYAEEARLQAIVNAEGQRTANGARAWVLLEGVTDARLHLEAALHREARVA